MAAKGSIQIHASTIEALRILTNSEAWETFFKPSLEAMKEEWLQKLMDPSEDRKKEFPDDYVRGAWATIDVFLSAPGVLIAEADARREREEVQRQETENLDLRLNTGHVGPMIDTEIDSQEGY